MVGSRLCSALARAAAAAAIVALAAGAAEAQTTVRVGKAIAQPFDFTPLDVGMAEGFFARHGLKIDEIDFAGSAKLQQALAARAIDIGRGSGPELVFVAKGNSDLGVAEFAGPSNGLFLVVRADSNIHSVAELKGRKISVSSVNSLTDWMVRQVSVRQGWGHDGIDVVALGSDEAQVAAMRAHLTDGQAMDVATAGLLEKKGRVRVILRFGDIVHDFINHITYANDDFMQNHPGELRGFLAGWYETVKWMRVHKAGTVKIVAPVMGVPDDIAAIAYDTVMPTLTDNGQFNPKGLATLARSWVDMKLVPAAPDMAKLITEKFLPPAVATQ